MIAIFEQDHERYQVDIPFDLSARTFEQFCDFRTAEALFHQDAPIEERLVHYDTMLQHMAPGDIDKLPSTVGKESITDLIEQKFHLSLEAGTELSKDRLYAHIIYLIQEYKPDKIPRKFRIRVAGKHFLVEKMSIARKLLQQPLGTGEVIEVLEYQRRAGTRMDAKPLEIGNLDFNLGLTELAILLPEKGKRLPSGRDDRLRIINQRKEALKGVDLATIMDLRYFFLDALLRYATTRSTPHFGKARLVPTGQRKRTSRGNVKRWLRRLGR